ncbi:Erd2 protein [Starmerella bacillaris]|uniref:ER lumen protein-retaining receptor n=1 Tax=Starmerella bacillaris TaxID=1247836 RepID=A0AAV5RLW8_STABA|nr:Erd2 protein [Starmerella bacillaris]
MFNIFRIAGDVCHLVSIGLLLSKVTKSQSVAGLSFKTQALYMLVYITRYLDLIFGRWTSVYNTIFKFIYLGTSGYVLYLMTSKYKSTRSPPSVDTFKIQYLLGFSAVFALLFHLKFTLLELLWSFSIWLESVAILPQLFMIQRTGKAETMTTHYICALGLYRVLYVLNWIYRSFTKDPSDKISFCGGIIQTLLYSDFFYVYYSKVYHGQNFTLPV